MVNHNHRYQVDADIILCSDLIVISEMLMFGLPLNLYRGFNCRNRIVEATTAESITHLDSEKS